MGVFLIMVLLGTPIYLVSIGASPWIIGAYVLLAGLLLLWLVWPSIKDRLDPSERARPGDGKPTSRRWRRRT